MNSKLICRLGAPLGLVTVAVLVAATAYGQYAAGVRGWLLGVELVLGVVGLALLPWMFHRPVRGALTLAVLAAVAPTVTPTSTVGTLHVATRERLPVAIGVAMAGTAAHALRGLWLPMPGLSYGWWLVLTVVCHAALVAMGALTQTRHALIGSLRERAERAEAEQGRRVAEARAAERAAIAREMHDVLAHRLSLVATYAGALEYRPDHPPERLSAAAGVIRSSVHQALEELRDVITLLNDDEATEPDRPMPALTDLPGLVAESRAIGTPVEIRDVRAEPAEPAGPTGRTAYRVVQEALTNARKHAPGEPVSIELDGAPGNRLRIDVRNPLPRTPVTPLPSAGRGLVGLTERVRLAGGQLDHRATATEFRLTASLPWPA
ncbi:sensor histidine kinase [Actinophytocola xinjiangensis]|uniref:histidine kinase n=1 Tax=Actinophytocola xinjiangensis TaxID=485602 RepID=A0A7Z0WRD4_9PSEU|nr:sensor histidine kinase [Actinophytocola xinjiangensis]OLF13031.1 sensor histidine kinase [Actinophytocola xinjiangensis]